MFSMNGSPYSQTGVYTQLEPGIYELLVLDANGCENVLLFDIQQPQELNVELVISIEGENNVITLGEDVTMTGVDMFTTSTAASAISRHRFPTRTDTRNS